jgi:ABC-type amino acid transport system permease subunit
LTILQVLLVGLAVGLAFGLVRSGLLNLGGLIVGSVVGLPGGLAMLSSGAWLSYILALFRLATSRQLPLRLMSFLDDAYRLGLLRTTGPAYQFRHAEFHDHLVRAGKSRVEAEQH